MASRNASDRALSLAGVVTEPFGQAGVVSVPDFGRRIIVEKWKERVPCIVPEIRKVHQFTVTRMERYIVACYSAEDGGHFRARRDNTTKGTAHRRFAVSVNLN